MKPTLRSEKATKHDSLCFEHCSVDFGRNEIVFNDGQRSPFSPLQADLLKYMATRGGVPVTRDELLSKVWKIDPSRTLTRTVDMLVSQLRRKLGDNPDNPRILLTVHGHGYALASKPVVSPNGS